MEDLQRLIEIQRIDDDITVEKLEQEALEENVEKKTRGVENAKIALKNHEDQLFELKKGIDRKNLIIKEKDVAVENDRATLTRITSNKEYKAILTQIEKDKADLSIVEDELLEEMGSIDEVEEKIKEEELLVKEHESVLARKKEEVKGQIGSSSERVTCLEEKRSAVSVGIDSEIMEAYTKLSGRADGKAVASADGGVCGGCNMTLTSQTISELIKGDEIIRCMTCGRILYLQDGNP